MSSIKHRIHQYISGMNIFSKSDNDSFPEIIKMHSRKSNLFDVIVFPYIDLDDPMNAMLFRKATNEMAERFTGSYARVDICAIRDIVQLAHLTLWGKAAEALEWLTKLHCVNFKDLHPEIAAQVPHRINMVFSCGEYVYPWEAA